MLFRRRETGKWRAGDADRFGGMVLHAVSAAFFCILPSWVAVFVREPPQIWAIASGVLAADLVFHTTIIFRLRTTRGYERAMVASGYAFALLLLGNALGIGFPQEFPPYLAGVLWHVFLAGFLFVYLIWIRAEDVEDD